MKLSSSPSLSSSTTSSISYQSNVFTTKRATISCLAGVLRRMLCTRSLPTHPSDQIIEEPSSADGRTPNYTEKGSSPGIVARLMGLESLPENYPTEAPNSVSRSRSMSSVEQWTEECGEERDRRKKVETSRSFREMPTYLEVEDEEFLVLSFGKGSGGKEMWSKQRKYKKGKMERYKTEENRAADKDSSEICSPRPRNPTGSSEMADRATNVTELMKSRRKSTGHGRKSFGIKKAEAEDCSSEDASPVSVLDFGERITDDPGESATASDDSAPDNSNSRSRRKLSAELENSGHSSDGCSDSSSIHDPEGPGAEENPIPIGFGSWKKDFCREMWSAICEIAETQIMDSNWLSSGVGSQLGDSEGVVELGEDLGMQVLDHLLDELVEHLVGRGVEH